MQINGYPLRELFDISNPDMAEQAYRIVSTAWKQSLLEAAEKAKQELDAERYEKELALGMLEEVGSEKEDIQVNLKKVMQEKYELVSELEDAKAKRDAAADELEEAKKEIKRLNAQIDDLRKEIAVGAANAPKVIDIGESMKEWVAAKAAAEAAKPAIYDVHAVDFKQSRFSAKLAETDEPFEFGYLEKNKFREVTAEEAEVFRTEFEAKRPKQRQKRLNRLSMTCILRTSNNPALLQSWRKRTNLLNLDISKKISIGRYRPVRPRSFAPNTKPNKLLRVLRWTLGKGWS
ncbi:hypothetical protein D3C74_327430 [compost metagenome]